MKTLQIVPKLKKDVMRKLLNEYLTELSQFDSDVKFDETNTPIYNWFDVYWKEKNRFPIFFLVENNIAGFCMIRELDDMVYNFAEFYVCPEFRKDNNALTFATMVTNLFDGKFRFATRFTNKRAFKFWTKFANSFKIHSFVDDDIWRDWTIR